MRIAILAPLLLGLCACGKAPQRVPASASASSDRNPATARVRFAGRIHLAGALAAASAGSISVSARAPGARSPALERTYEIGDPAWSVLDRERALYFGLDERDGVGALDLDGVQEMELEARYLPGGAVDGQDGGARTSLRARPGDLDLALVLGPRSGG